MYKKQCFAKGKHKVKGKHEVKGNMKPKGKYRKFLTFLYKNIKGGKNDEW
jgi:hypothetical protein